MSTSKLSKPYEIFNSTCYGLAGALPAPPGYSLPS